MQRFVFPLEKALEWRTSRFDLENAKLSQLIRERDNLVRLTVTLREASLLALRSAHEGVTVTSGAALSQLAGYRDALEHRLRRVAAQVRSCEQRLEQQRKSAISADRDKQLLERLKAQKLDEWNYEYSRELEDTAADLYLARFTRTGVARA